VVLWVLKVLQVLQDHKVIQVLQDHRVMMVLQDPAVHKDLAELKD
jgi:hypothetical protein